MSLLINETFASSEVPLWLDKDLASSNFKKVTWNGAVTVTAGGTCVLGTITFPSAVNFCTLQGWIAVQDSGNSGTVTGDFYLSTSTTYDNTKSNRVTGCAMSGTAGSPATNYYLSDGLMWYGSAGTTSLNLVFINTGSGSSSSLQGIDVSGSIAYSALPSITGWTISQGSGGVFSIAG